jgi:hypothetical protein
VNAAPPPCSFDLDGPAGAERSFWYRVSSSAVLVGAGLGWISAILACCLAAPLSLAFRAGDECCDSGHDDL